MEKDIQEMEIEDSIGPRYVQVDFPGNSHKNKMEQTTPEKKVKRITSGSAVKKSIIKKLAESFLGESVSNVFVYLVSDVIIPASKDLIMDAIEKGGSMLIYGEEKSPSKNKYSSYSNVYYGGKKVTASKPRSKSFAEDIIIPSRDEAEEVLENLLDSIKEYGMVSVADYYESVGYDFAFTDNSYGWTNLRSARIVHVRGGWLIKFPRLEVID